MISMSLGFAAILYAARQHGHSLPGKGSLKYLLFFHANICFQLACNGIFAETLKAKYLDIKIMGEIEKRH